MQESILFGADIDDRSLDDAVDEVNQSFEDATADVSADISGPDGGMGGLGGVRGPTGDVSDDVAALVPMADYRNRLLEDVLDEGGMGGGGDGGTGILGGKGLLKSLGITTAAVVGSILGGAGLKSAFENAGGFDIMEGDMPTVAEMIGSASIAFGGPIGGLFSGAITNAIENITWPSLPSLSDLSWPSFPDLSGLSWPDLPPLPDLSTLQWPDLPEIQIQRPDWLSELPSVNAPDLGGGPGSVADSMRETGKRVTGDGSIYSAPTDAAAGFASGAFQRLNTGSRSGPVRNSNMGYVTGQGSPSAEASVDTTINVDPSGMEDLKRQVVDEVQSEIDNQFAELERNLSIGSGGF